MLKKTFSLRLLAACGVCLIVAACSNPEATKARHLEQGKAHMAAGRVEDAILEFRNALKIDQRYGEARYELAKAFEQTGNPNAAREYVRAAELLPENLDAQLKAGTILLAQREFELARKHADLALKIDPTSVEAQIIRAYTLAGLKDMEGAIAELERASESAPGDYRPYAGLGAVEAASGDMEAAEAAFRKAVDADPKSVPARLALAYFYWSVQKAAEAERTINEVIAEDQNNVAANRLLALVYAATGRASDAETPLLRLVNQKDMRAVLVLGDLYVGTNRPDRARQMYEKLREEQATREMGVARLAGLDFRAGRKTDAYAAVDQQLADTPRSVPLLTLKTQMLLADNRREEALETARKVAEIAPESSQAQFILGVAEAANRNTDAALAAQKEALRLDPNNAAAQLELSRLMLATGQTDEGLQLAQSAKKAAPQSALTHINVVRALLQKGDLRQAETDVKSLLQQLPNSSTVHALHGRILLAKSDVPGATRAFDRALELNATDVEAIAGRVAIDLSKKRPQDGRARIESALAKAPDNPALLLTAAQLERVDGKYDAAERYLRKAIEVDPTNIVAYNQLAGLYIGQNRLEEGKRELQELVRRRPDSIPARTMIAIIEQTQGRNDEAIKLYDAIVKETSTAAVAANNLAYLLADRGEQLDRAIQLAQSAKQQLPENPDVSDTLGWAYYKKGMPELAIQPLEFSVQKDPKNPLYLLHLGLAYAKAGKKDLARTTLQKALSLNANVDGAAEARAVLADLQN
jgi:tetratricopeptide (TPR) repeat protein